MSRPSKNGHVTENQAGALAHLYATIAELVDDGRSIPCLGRHGVWWTSTDSEEQQAAALRCGDCPALAACRSYIAEYRELSGVWAGQRCGR